MKPWEYEQPEALGIDASMLDRYVDRLAERHSRAVLVIRRDKIIKEWYAREFGPQRRHYSASLAKTLVGGLSLAVSVSEGYMTYNDLACQYIERWKDDPLKSQITLRQLATHTSGLADSSARDVGGGWQRMFWQKDPSPDALDPITCALDLAPMLEVPGKRFIYSNPGIAALSYCITSALQGSPYADIRELLQERIMKPLGIEAAEWSIGYGKPFAIDGLNVYAAWGGGEYTARAVGRIGQLLLHKGQWNGESLIQAGFLKPMLSCTFHSITQPGFPEAFLPTPSAGGFSNHCSVFPSIPDCAFFGTGAGHQLLLVIPSLDLVVVRMGESMQVEPYTDDGFWLAVKEELCDPLPDMLLHRSPYPASDAVRNVRFEPAERIKISGEDSDNWPCTWAADGELYTSYGDGYGFLPHTEKKLSLGFATIHGEPGAFEGVNLRTETGEREGDGASGPKASGLVMVDGVLYMLARNAGNARLAWSEDMGKTWEWGFKFETSFGCPTFVNYGRNYAGAPDDYVYIYSPDGGSAYEEYDGIVLARVHRRRIRQQNDYEYFQGLAEDGEPIWTTDVESRGPVFTFPNRCHRLEAIYHEATKRYWLVSACNHEGGWGIFDSPTPYGPWTTDNYTQDWRLGKTHAYRFPTKWIRENGKQLYLVFSGRRFKTIDYDAMCVREMRLDLAVEADS